METRSTEGPLLSEQEIADLRTRVRRELETDEQERHKAQQRQEASRSLRSQRIRQIEREEEERFYSERGYRRFVDRVGNVRWLNPEQYARWEEERAQQQRRRHSLGHRLGGRKARRTILLVVASVTLVLFAVFLAVLRRG